MGKFEWTKIIYAIVILLTIGISICACVATFKFGDTSIIITLITAIFAELGIYSATYAWKTKTINKTKILLDFINKLPDDVTTKENIIVTLISNME